MRTFFIVILLVSSIAACSSRKIKTEVKEEVAREPVAQNSNELLKNELQTLEKTENLTDDQKEKLHSLLLRSRGQMMSIDQDILKTKSVLFKTLLDERSSQAKVNYLENQLLKLNRKRVRESLSSFREARKIVGKSDYSLDRTLNLIDSSTKEIHNF